ncbi:hypothetical protein HanRHA438_Chr01g0015951 [Helianthus annuus]|nr:hypothetical protein HanRHA438_Chr01g0015951 [Helianthus annuus]
MPDPFSFYFARHAYCTTLGSLLTKLAYVLQRHPSNPYTRTRIPNFVGWSDKYGIRMDMNVGIFRIRLVSRWDVFRSVQTFIFLLGKIDNLFHHITIYYCTIGPNLLVSFKLG